jgi:hypothetical protein
MLMLLGSRQPFALAMRRCLDELSCTSPPIRLRLGPSPVGHDVHLHTAPDFMGSMG